MNNNLLKTAFDVAQKTIGIDIVGTKPAQYIKKYVTKVKQLTMFKHHDRARNYHLSVHDIQRVSDIRHEVNWNDKSIIGNMLKDKGYGTIAFCMYDLPEGVWYEDYKENGHRIVHIYFSTPKSSWMHLAGREGHFWFCPFYNKIIKQQITVMN